MDLRLGQPAARVGRPGDLPRHGAHGGSLVRGKLRLSAPGSRVRLIAGRSPARAASARPGREGAAGEAAPICPVSGSFLLALTPSASEQPGAAMPATLR